MPRTACLVQQGVWETPLESMPLAQGYLKAAALADERIRAEMDLRIHNFRGGRRLPEMARALFRDGPPDVLACSVLGWNQREFGALAETFKQLNPNGWVVFGGTHVANQGERVLRMYPEVDVVVDGEGELVFADVLRAFLDGRPRDRLGDIAGLTYRAADGTVVQNPPRARIERLDDIPSPFLTGAIELTDAQGRFRYDVALMETNRGCPYKCSFCYWGGAVGQKVRSFSRERLRAELELFARLRVHTIVLCDANFGMLPADLAFVEDLIEVRDRFGYPRALETSWAKNKSRTFHEIVRRMRRAGLRSSFTLALQTLDDAALDLMHRRNMKVNDWEELADRLAAEGLECYAELIWPAPGETVESFMDGYDRLSRRVSRIACYPMLLLPNTEYAEKKDAHGIVSVRGDHDDFEYVLADNTVTMQENERMQRFLYWARVLAEMCVLRHVWVGLRELAGLSQSAVLRDFAVYVEHSTAPAAAALRDGMRGAIAGDVGGGAGRFFTDPDTRLLLQRWWDSSLGPRLPRAAAPVLDEMFRYDLLTHPVCGPAAEDLPVVPGRGGEHFLRADVELAYDVPALVAALRAGEPVSLAPAPTTVDLCYRVGAENAVFSTNHEEIVHFMGEPVPRQLPEARERPA
ncbi:MAG TPA: KedN5 family methylcobalamin-dependent radical SAM C-methyltransferase [Dactylosporangium sp.]|nr:KedN5 family methylcobalamin-dependent radical SAM C-methyltransferase [Dactylosporangium sp.]